jgi:dTDP-4-amino-4,6-dideoxygalactose transaminase
MKALGIGKGDRVAIADFGFPAAALACLELGAEPLFVDVDPDTYNMTGEYLDEALKACHDEVKAIIPIHTFGQMCNMDDLVVQADYWGIPIIEDAACALGSNWRGKPPGQWSKAACFSFHARKGITTGEGGMIITDDDELAEFVRKYAHFGILPTWERENKEFQVPRFENMGFNFKMSDIQAAVGIAQMSKIDKIIEKKRYLASILDGYVQANHDKFGLMIPPWCNPSAFHIYQSYVCRAEAGTDRNELIQIFAEGGWQCGIGGYAAHLQPVFHSIDECENSAELAKQTIALPIFYEMEFQGEEK